MPLFVVCDLLYLSHAPLLAATGFHFSSSPVVVCIGAPAPLLVTVVGHDVSVFHSDCLFPPNL